MGEAPESRPRDANGCPIPTPLQVKEEAILNARIVREQARIEATVNNRPVAGHDFAAEHRERTQGGDHER